MKQVYVSKFEAPLRVAEAILHGWGIPSQRRKLREFTSLEVDERDAQAAMHGLDRMVEAGILSADAIRIAARHGAAAS